MSDPKTPTQDSKPAAMTAAKAAKLVKRTVHTVVPAKDDKPASVKTERVPVKESEVLACRDYGTHVVVVTTDGQKLTSADQGAQAETAEA